MLKACFGLCAATAIWACGDGQAEDDYLGEPLFSAHGSVLSNDLELTRGVTLGLQFSHWMPPATVEQVIKAEVVGSFPSAFTMRIYEPPPPEVVVAIVPGEPAFATGTLVAVRPDHPGWLRQQTFGSITGGPLVVRTCTRDGQCRDIDLNAPGCGSPPDYRPCHPDDPWTVYNPTGQTEDYRFIYFAAAAPAGSVTSRYFAGGLPIAKGYHLLIDKGTHEDTETTEADTACYLRAAQRANAAVNTRHGREPAASIDSELAVELAGEQMIAMVAEGCSQPNVRWVDDPNTASLSLTFFTMNSFTP